MSVGRVCAVIVTFQPRTESLLRTLAALASEVDGIVIVDNGSARLEEPVLRTIYPTLVVRKLESNHGIGTAQNVGMDVAGQLGYTHALLLDQDSVPEDGMVRRLRSFLERMHEQRQKVACVGPRVRFPGSAQLSTFTTPGWLRTPNDVCQEEGSSVECEVLLSSGSLIPLDVVQEIGGMEEALFIDQVDTEWCLRARSQGYRIFGVCGAVLEHRLGESTLRLWLGRWRNLPRHKPFRYYYIFRNTIVISRRGYTSWKWKLINLRWLAALFLIYGILTRERSGELSMMVKGALHGIRGITGRMSD